MRSKTFEMSKTPISTIIDAVPCPEMTHEPDELASKPFLETSPLHLMREGARFNT
jgi:hypothetical protein